jgi:hypothetical protein
MATAYMMMIITKEMAAADMMMIITKEMAATDMMMMEKTRRQWAHRHDQPQPCRTHMFRNCSSRRRAMRKLLPERKPSWSRWRLMGKLLCFLGADPRIHA